MARDYSIADTHRSLLRGEHMKLAIMQPYVFPYLGYFQLVAASDRFLFLDDVAFRKQGWINRNRLEFSGSVAYFTVPLSQASPNRTICEIETLPAAIWMPKLLRSMAQSYASAPRVRQVLDLVEYVIDAPDRRISTLASRSVVLTAECLGLSTTFGWTSKECPKAELHGSARVLDICTSLGANVYFNLPGGRDLYLPQQFDERGVALRFIDPLHTPYERCRRSFIPGLSVLDALMFHEPTWIADLIRRGVPT